MWLEVNCSEVLAQNALEVRGTSETVERSYLLISLHDGHVLVRYGMESSQQPIAGLLDTTYVSLLTYADVC